MRLDKLLADMGAGTRSHLKKDIRNGHVSVNGVIVTDAGMIVDPDHCEVTFDGQPVVYQKYHYYMLNKPKDTLCVVNSPKTVMNLIDEPYRDLFPVGRLDKDTEGLLLIMNDGPLAHQLLSPKHHVDKIYRVVLRDPITSASVKPLEEGIVIDGDEKCLPASCEIIDDHTCLLTIHEGKYHQVKRMFKAIGNEVTDLKRLKIKNLMLDESLAPGEYRELTEEEIKDLKASPSGEQKED